MSHARIYQPAKTAVQSGRFKTRQWIVEMEPTSRKEADRLIGWVGSDDTAQQLRLTFPTREAAIAYCERQGLTFSVSPSGSPTRTSAWCGQNPMPRPPPAGPERSGIRGFWRRGLAAIRMASARSSAG